MNPLRCFIPVFLLLCLNSNAETELTFQPDSACGKDVSVFSLFADNNYANRPDWLATAWTNNGNPSNARGLVAFDLSVIPANATVVSATLYLYHALSPYNVGHSNLSGPAQCWLERIVQPWNENTVTWNNQPVTTTQNRVFVPAPLNNSQDYVLNVTSLVTDMLNDPTNSHGFMLRQQTETYYRSLLFASSDHSASSLHPKLVVVYDLNELPASGCWTNVLISPDSSFPVPPSPEGYVFLPNVFTPNTDGINDVFFPDTMNALVEEMIIYDRWGILVFDSKPGMSWDGRSTSGSECTTGTYYFVIRYSVVGHGEAIETGFVTLLR